jgi:hypothetical protein
MDGMAFQNELEGAQMESNGKNLLLIPLIKNCKSLN